VSTQGPAQDHDVVLRLLDHQIMSPEGGLLGNVDDLELVARGRDWLVTGLMVGPAALSQRLPGLLGDWVYAVWYRLHPAEDPATVVVPIEHVTRIDSAVHLDSAAAQALSQSFGLEVWLRAHVVSRLPGATGDAQGEHGAVPAHGRRVGRRAVPAPDPARAPLEGASAVSSLVGRSVLSVEGARVGLVSELRCEGAPHDVRQVPLRVASVVYSPHLAGSQLGYSIDRSQGPALVRHVVRLWQRRDRIVLVEQMAGLEAEDGDLRLLPGARPRHPHDTPADPRRGPGGAAIP